MAKLWEVIHGEPFMVNPHLGILGLNPRKKKGKASVMAKRYGKAHMDWVRSFRKNGRRRRRKSNPSVRHYARRASRAVSRSVRHHGRRAAGAMGFLTLPPLQSVLYVGVGLAGTPLAEGFISGYLPASITGSTIGKYAVRIGTVLGLSFLVKSLMGREQAKLVAVGGGVYVAMSALRQFAPGMIPGVSGYVGGGPMLNAYTPTASRGMNAYRNQLSSAFALDYSGGGIAKRFQRL